MEFLLECWNDLGPMALWKAFTNGEYSVLALLLIFDALILFMALVALAWGYRIFDTWFTGSKVASGKVADHAIYNPPYTAWIMSGKAMVPMNHPARWDVDFEFHGMQASSSFTSDPRAIPGEVVEVEYGIGRLSREPHIKQVNWTHRRSK